MTSTPTDVRPEGQRKALWNAAACTVVLSCLLGGAACAGPAVIPPELQDQVDPTITFRELQKDPEQFRGRLIVLGGSVISARRLAERTQIEVLQLPLDESLEPETILRRSEGRFLAFYEGFLDPAVLPAGTRITVVGEVTGSVTGPLDESTYTYPTLTVKKMTIWPYMLPGYKFVPYPYLGAYRGPYVGPPPGFEEKAMNKR